MGRHFKLIDDRVVKPLADELQAERCDCCSQGKPQFFLFGPLWYMALGLRGNLTPAEVAKYQMSRVCLDCLKKEFPRPTRIRWTAAVASLRSPGRFDAAWPIRRLLLARDLAVTPPYAFFSQEADWPVCCRQCCEFRGWPADGQQLREAVQSYRYWERGPQARSPFDSGEEIYTEDPSTDVNLFGCSRCGTGYYTHQIS